MASVFHAIADAVVDVLENLTGAPDTIEVRMDDAWKGTDTPPLIVVTMGDEDIERYLSGAGTLTDQGDVFKTYQIGVTIYRRKLEGLADDLAQNQDFVLLAQQALNRKSLTGVSEVYGATLVRRTAWEHQDFHDGKEVSRFGIVFYASETRLGN